MVMSPVYKKILSMFSKNNKPEDVIAGIDAIELATQRQLIWRRFKRHRLGFSATIVIVLFYLIVLFADFQEIR